MSSSATSSSSTSSPSSSNSSTFTWSGAATSALAMCSIKAFGLGEELVMLALDRVAPSFADFAKGGNHKIQKLLTAEIAKIESADKNQSISKISISKIQNLRRPWLGLTKPPARPAQLSRQSSESCQRALTP